MFKGSGEAIPNSPAWSTTYVHIVDLDTFKYELWILCLYGEKFKKQEKTPVG